jgi:hypothetical protein
MSFSLAASRTVNLSSGARPVCAPVRVTSAPPSPSDASSRRNACSNSDGVVRFQ